jgi:hypothetical protein
MDVIKSGLETIRGGLRCICSRGGDYAGAHDSGEECACQCTCPGSAQNETAVANAKISIASAG